MKNIVIRTTLIFSMMLGPSSSSVLKGKSKKIRLQAGVFCVKRLKQQRSNAVAVVIVERILIVFEAQVWISTKHHFC